MRRFFPSMGLGALALSALMVLLSAPDAFAFIEDAALGNMTCNSDGSVSGSLFVAGASCPTMLTMDQLFSFLICNFEQLSGNILGHMFCGMISNLAPIVWVATTFATVLFGIGFTIGLIPARAGEAMKFLFKIMFVTLMATNADYLIGFGYKFFLSMMSDGAAIALGVMNNNANMQTSADVYAEIDKLLANLFHFATDMVGGTTPADYCKNAVFAVMALMAAILPMMAYVGLLLIGRLVLTFFRAVFAYIYAIVGIAFLLTLAPFFLTFFLFRQTTNLFERWIGYLVSFSLQVILLFSFLAFVILIEQAVTKDNILKNLMNIVYYKQEAPETTALRFNFTYCTLCDFKIVDGTQCPQLNSPDPAQQAAASSCTAITPDHKDANGNNDYISVGRMACTSNPPVAITPTFASSPDGKNQVGNLLNLLGEGLLPLLILATIIENLLKLIPSLAQKLGSSLNATYASQIGGGWVAGGGVATRMPGESMIDDFNAGFNSGYYQKGGSENGIGKAAQGLREGLSGLVTGRLTNQQQLYDLTGADPNTRGITNSFARWASDPNRFGL